MADDLFLLQVAAEVAH